ncbi:MAG: NADH-quinone oxidoreductase subunit NuoK [Planctomycetota bacterium]|nr:NADH-quinone oxidoreductase subunit NuoK [Planctomycetota bacterium]
MIPLDHCLYLSAALFVIGFLGILTRRNLIVMLMCVEIMLNAANLSLVAFSQSAGDASGQVLVFFAIAVAAAEVAVGLVIALVLFRLRKTVNSDEFRSLRL